MEQRTEVNPSFNGEVRGWVRRKETAATTTGGQDKQHDIKMRQGLYLGAQCLHLAVRYCYSILRGQHPVSTDTPHDTTTSINIQHDQPTSTESMGYARPTGRCPPKLQGLPSSTHRLRRRSFSSANLLQLTISALTRCSADTMRSVASLNRSSSMDSCPGIRRKEDPRQQ